MQPQRKKPSYIGSLVFSLVIIGVVAAAYWQRYFIYDQIRLWKYQPSAAITQIASDTTMLAGSKRVFYANHPSLDDRTIFSGHCSTSEKTIILGCFVSGKGIYLFDVTDSRLRGIVQVTAAHEVLHAEYERLGSSDKKKVDAMTAAAYAKVTSQRVRDTVKSYEDSGADIANELHSILATEVRNLPNDLEEYYGRYFDRRAAIVTLSEQYENEFTSRQRQVAAYDEQLKTMKQQIDQLESTLKQQAQQINTSYDQLKALRAANDIEAYNAGVPRYNRSVSDYNSQVKKAQALISEYNAIVAKRNALAMEENQLTQAIDSRPSTIQSQ